MLYATNKKIELATSTSPGQRKDELYFVFAIYFGATTKAQREQRKQNFVLLCVFVV